MPGAPFVTSDASVTQAPQTWVPEKCEQRHN